MNPTEIADALEEIAARRFDGGEFPFAFAAAMGSPQATVSKLRSGTINKSKVPGAVLMNRKYYAIVTDPGAVDQGLSMIRSDKKTTTHKPAILLATDGVDLSAEHVASGDSLHIKFADLHHHFGFFLPAAGMSRYKAAEENEVDVKAAGRLAKLYDALLKKNPEWKTPERRHDLNQLMTRLIFCMFAEDVGIFENNLFSRLIFTHAGDKGEEAQACIASAFAAMNLPNGRRQDLPAWADAFPYVNGELRAREIRVLERLAQLDGGASAQMFSGVRLANFYGIEITDFAAETAKLALFIAEYQANARFGEMFGNTAPALPLRDGGNIVCENSLRLDWNRVCPPPSDDEEVFIAGNPPFLGKAQQEASHKADKDLLFGDLGVNYKAFDYVVGWFYKAGQYIKDRPAQAALVATNSIAQGDAASTIWPLILGGGREIGFAHRTFKWRNNASANAAVMCVIVGIRNRSNAPKTLFDGDLKTPASHINSYLLNMSDMVVRRLNTSLFGLPEMQFGNMPYDAGKLLMKPSERDQLLDHHPEAAEFVRRFMGSQEVVKGIERYCLWIDDEKLEEASKIVGVRKMIEATRAARLDMKDKAGRDLAERPHQFREHYAPRSSAILVPGVTSERRPYLPVERVGADVIASNLNFALYDAPEWCLALIASRLHLVWIGTVCGKLKSDFRYSNTLGWNTFPVPRFTDDQLEALNASARSILKTRYMHHPKTIAQLYDPDDMPDDLREVHRQNDELLETMYIGRPFRNDTERLERLFKLYAARIEKLKKEEAA